MVDGGTAPREGLAATEKKLLKQSGSSDSAGVQEQEVRQPKWRCSAAAAGHQLIGASQVTPPSLGMKLAGTVIAAFMFGWALNKGGVYRADVIQDQFMFTNNTMLVRGPSCHSAECAAARHQVP